MKRGMLTLSQAQVRQLLSLVQTAGIEPTSWSSLLYASQATEDPVAIESGEQTVELWLDLLPPPQTADDPQLAELRQALQQFLTHLRS